MFRQILLATLAVALEPTAVSAQEAPIAEQASETLSIAAGETVTARIGQGRFVVASRERGEASGEPPAGTVRFSMTADPGMTMLQVENGTDRAFEYRARMFLGRRSARTSTCTVLPGMAGFEHWPHAIDRIELSAPELLGGSGSGMRCR
jgi:hypothetical protein